MHNEKQNNNSINKKYYRLFSELVFFTFFFMTGLSNIYNGFKIWGMIDICLAGISFIIIFIDIYFIIINRVKKDN